MISAPENRRGRGKPQLWHLLLVVAGAAVGLAVFVDRSQDPAWAWGALGIFGGVALIGPPLLLLERRKDRHRLRAGELLWFTQGTAAWLLWPPIVYGRINPPQGMGRGTTAICFAYGTPLMSLYLVIALIAGDWIRIRRRGKRKRRPRSWMDTVGLLLGFGWACVGLYFLATFWADDLRRP